jgi:NAD(P)-dependent dehydrogenase (short-subunit alcohol dehydrogenase family)
VNEAQSNGPLVHIASGVIRPTGNTLTKLRFDDQAIVVTGAGRGIGRSHALLLAARGARVVVADHGGNIDGSGSSRSPADDVVREIIDAGGHAVACHASVADERGANEIVTTALDAFRRVDAVVNNAGIHDPGLFEDLSVDQFRTMLEVHYFGTLFVTRAAWRHFVAAGYGRVVNTVSEAMFGGIPELSSYGAAKGAVFGLTRNLATEGLPRGIKVNAIAPRAFTRLSASHSDKVAATMSMTREMMDQVNASMPPNLCAPAAAFLAHESCPLNGEVLQIGMGSVARIAVVYSQGLSKPTITAEDIAENLDAVMDLRDVGGQEGTLRRPEIATSQEVQ